MSCVTLAASRDTRMIVLSGNNVELTSGAAEMVLLLTYEKLVTLQICLGAKSPALLSAT